MKGLGLRWNRLGAIWFALCAALCLQAASPNEHFESGNQWLAKGQPAEALAAYGQIAPDTTSAALEFNRGLAHLQLTRLGHALVHLRRAQRLAPRDHEIRQALTQVRARVATPTQMNSALGDALGRLSLNEWGVLAGVAWWVWFGLMLVGRTSAAARQVVGGYVLSFGLVAVVLAATLFLAWWTRSREPSVIVTQANAAVRVSPLDEAKVAFTANDGAEFRLTESRPGWFRVEDETSGRAGWVGTQSASLVPLR